MRRDDLARSRRTAGDVGGGVRGDREADAGGRSTQTGITGCQSRDPDGGPVRSTRAPPLLSGLIAALVRSRTARPCPPDDGGA